MSANDALIEADDLAVELLLQLEALGIVGVVLLRAEQTILVRCQEREDVVPMCNRVIAEHSIPSDRTIN